MTLSSKTKHQDYQVTTDTKIKSDNYDVPSKNRKEQAKGKLYINRI